MSLVPSAEMRSVRQGRGVSVRRRRQALAIDVDGDVDVTVRRRVAASLRLEEVGFEDLRPQCKASTETLDQLLPLRNPGHVGDYVQGRPGAQSSVAVRAQASVTVK